MPTSLEKVEKFLKSDRYWESLRHIKKLKNKIIKSKKKDLAGIRKNAVGFFSKLRREAPGVYLILAIHETEIYRLIFKKRTGLDIR